MIQLVEKASQSSRPSGQARRAPKGFKCSAEMKFASAKVFARGENTCTHHPAQGAKKLGFVFDRGVYVGENTSRPANVRAASSAVACAAAGRNLSVEKGFAFFDGLNNGAYCPIIFIHPAV